MSFIDIALQCCDAGDYLSKGAECAQDNVCYGDLRPIGDYLWFSIPSRLGLPDKSLIAANFAVAAIGLLLSVFALRKLLSAVHNVTLSKSALLILLLLSACIHAIFLLPTIFNTLSDPPASMALLSGIWLLVLAHYNANVAARILQFFLGGLCLGLAVWLRAFYLYPVLAGLVVYMLLWIFSSKKKREELLVFLALLPIGVQFFVMHQMYGTYGYLGEESTSRWARAHLNTPYIGYDTIFPRDGYFWSPQHCAAT
ncbi:MAG TPA: hypothetical protein VLB90_07660, partial [Pseudomonadales bacterium]|nr:hypothetical protein [Pseudomonadales bacterium]